MYSKNYITSILIYFLVCLCIPSNLYAQKHLFHIQEINKKDGLPGRSIHNIIQDKKGFIWVSTTGAIGKYDGQKFQNWYSTDLGINDNWSCKIAVDNKNNIWFCETGNDKTKNHVGIIDGTTGNIYSKEEYTKGKLKSTNIYSLTNIEDGNFFFTTDQGIIYEYKDTLKEIYQIQKKNQLINCQKDNYGNYWISINNQIIKIDKTKKQTKYKMPEEIVQVIQFSPNVIVETALNKNHNYWILKNENFQPFKITPQNNQVTGLSWFENNYMSFIAKDKLHIKNNQNEIVFEYKRSYDNKFDKKLEGKLVYHDKFQKGITWLATTNGLIKITQKKNLFKKYLLGHSIRGIYNDDEKLWLGSYEGNYFTLKNKNIQSNFLGKHEKSYREIPIISFGKDLQNSFWIGTVGNTAIEIQEDNNLVIHNLGKYRYLLFFYNKQAKKIWFGTDNGLINYNPKTKAIESIPLPIKSHDFYIRQIYQNQKGIWLISNKGIFLMNAKTEKVIQYYSTENEFPYDNINHIHEDDDGVFWLATKGAGLIKWNIKKNTFEHFTKKEGLSNNFLYAVYEDDYENLWLPSNYGLMRFNKKTSAVKLYLEDDGISHKEFNTYAHFKANDGTIYLGGLNGVISFHPKDIHLSQINKAPLYLTQIKVLENDKNEFRNITDKFVQQQQIVLNPSDQILEINLTLLNYNSINKNQYAYKIKGHQKNWVYTSDNKISIINLPYGKYTLQFKARGETEWEYSELNIPLIVRKPFYLQWWFLTTMVILVLTAIYQFIRQREHNLIQKTKRLDKLVKERTAKIEQDKLTIEQQAEELVVLNQTQERFFTNITHEFRTPLALIISPVQQLLKKRLAKELKTNLQLVLKNAKNLQVLINQLLDISKLESNEMKVEVSQGDLSSYVSDLLLQLKPFTETKNQNLQFTTSDKHILVHFDKEKWTKIIYNLVSNAIKYTPIGGEIKVNLTKSSNGSLNLIVEDNGIGIEQKNIDKIFNRFYQVDNLNQRIQGGSGIGLALVKELVELQNGQIHVWSIIGEGTSFKVEIPLTPLSSEKKVSSSNNTTTIPNSSLLTNIKNVEQEEEKIKQEDKTLEILIIEDNIDMQTYIKNCLLDFNYQLHVASNGEEGIQKAISIIPDLIISDIMMPIKDGYEVVTMIRQNLSTSHIPIVLLTAKSSLESRLTGLERGADAFLTKPFSSEELTIRVKILIELRQLIQLRYQDSMITANMQKSPMLKKDDEFIQKLRTLVLDNLHNKELSNEWLSQQLLMSRTNFYKKVKALTNYTVGKYINIIKLQEAKRLIQTKGLSLSEAALESGFSSHSQFTKVCKRIYEKTPKEYFYV